MDKHQATMIERDRKLQQHLAEEHSHSLFADYFKEVIYGGIDGIITTFAVVAGFSGAALSNETTTQLSFVVVLLFGLANLFADATSMGLGNFLSVRSEQALYQKARKREEREIKESHDFEHEETITILIQKGFSEADACKLADIYRTNEEYWVDFMMRYELGLADPRTENPIHTGLATFTSFLMFGAIPLLPFILPITTSAGFAFKLSILGTFVALVSLGLLKWRVIGAKLWPSLFEVLIVGGVAAIIAFTVGSFFNL